jgi:hypothetical protein
MTFQTFCGLVCDYVNDAAVLEQIVYVPVKALFTSEVPGNARFQAAERASGIYIVTSRKPEAAQLANLNGRVLRQMYQQMVDTGGHWISDFRFATLDLVYPEVA